MRYLLYLTTDEEHREVQYLIDRKNDYWWMDPAQGQLHFPITNDMSAFHDRTLFDGELVLDVKNGKTQPKFLVFDCLVLDGQNLMNRTLDKRLGYFRQNIYEPYSKMMKEYPDEAQYMQFLVEMKSTQTAYGIEMMFRQVLPSLPHGNDGLIFTCRMTDYKHGTDPHILKWKTEEENSIDFRMTLDFPLITPDSQDVADGVTQPYLDYDALPVCNLHVYQGDNNSQDTWWSTLHLEPEEWEKWKALNEPLEDRIVECYMDAQKRWRQMRFRDDKKEANHISTVNSVIESITDRVTEKDLIDAAYGIRKQWKIREQKEKDRRAAEQAAAAEAAKRLEAAKKRKAEEQGGGRPSPAPAAGAR